AERFDARERLGGAEPRSSVAVRLVERDRAGELRVEELNASGSLLAAEPGGKAVLAARGAPLAEQLDAALLVRDVGTLVEVGLEQRARVAEVTPRQHQRGLAGGGHPIVRDAGIHLVTDLGPRAAIGGELEVDIDLAWDGVGVAVADVDLVFRDA